MVLSFHLDILSWFLPRSTLPSFLPCPILRTEKVPLLASVRNTQATLKPSQTVTLRQPRPPQTSYIHVLDRYRYHTTPATVRRHLRPQDPVALVSNFITTQSAIVPFTLPLLPPKPTPIYRRLSASTRRPSTRLERSLIPHHRSTPRQDLSRS